ncbi:M24 family metallopeptidase [Flexivirga caeni]|uniref:M24 family metallopeptidase n=1 Tax=Flexivirga caeni TaxID=2294115 RepID=UPI001FE660CB|nr:M24 family metallopeptidase [Flexivirga caeni]
MTPISPEAADGDLCARPFPEQEYLDRLGAVQARMTERSLSSLIVADPANLYYLTGYNAWSFYMPQCLIVPVDGDCHLFTRAMDAAGAHYTAFLPTDRIHGYPDQLVNRPDAHPFDWIAARALEIGVLTDDVGGYVGAEFDAHFFSVRSYLSLRSALKTAALVDSNELVNWVRVRKSPLERAMLHSAGRIAQRVMEIALGELEPGRRQCDVVAEIQHAQALGAQQLGGDYPAIVPMLPTGETAGTPHLTWSDLPLRRGEATTVELAGVFHRYHAPLARTVVLGKAPRRLVDCAEATSEGMAAVLEKLRPGTRTCDVHREFAETIGKYGLTKESRIGYSIGIGYPPDWGERTVSLRPGDETVIEENMAFHVILGMWMDGWGYETSESLLIGPDGPDLLTDIPRGLTIKA